LQTIISTLAGLFFLATTAAADEQTLTATQIRALLSGNTAIGHWIDHNYRQYFDETGSTIYAQENTRSAVGRWRVNTETHQYESWWDQSGWGSGYNIVLKDGTYYWIGGGASQPQPFTVETGQKLVAPD